jgi:hypothetical protein
MLSILLWRLWKLQITVNVKRASNSTLTRGTLVSSQRTVHDTSRVCVCARTQNYVLMSVNKQERRWDSSFSRRQAWRRPSSGTLGLVVWQILTFQRNLLPLSSERWVTIMCHKFQLHFLEASTQWLSATRPDPGSYMDACNMARK